MNRYKKLINNSLIFAIGNLGSRFISIILVPLYTYYLTTTGYGTVDIITTTTNMLLPIISLSIFDAVLRFVMDKTQDKSEILTNAFIVTSIGSIVAILLYPILSSLHFIDGYLFYTIILLIVQAFSTLFSQFCRAIGSIKEFASNGILLAVVTGLMNVILLVWLKHGISGYILSMIIGNSFSIIFLIYKVKIYKFVLLKKFSSQCIYYLLKYSIPLIPNAFIWWIVNASNRYFILYFIGASANGLYAVSSKIPTLLSMLNSIFFQAWQLSAIEEFDSKSKSNFYSDIFEYLRMMLFIGASGILVVLKPVLKFAVAPAFFDSWKYVPLLLLGVIFSSFSGFLGTNYIAAKQTTGVFKTSIVGGIVSITSSMLFVPSLGVQGATLSTVFSFFSIWILRVYDTKKFIIMNINFLEIIINISIFILQFFVLYLGLDMVTEFIIQLLLFSSILLVNRSLLKAMIRLFQK